MEKLLETLWCLKGGGGRAQLLCGVSLGEKLVAWGIVSLLLKLGNLHTVLTHFVSGRSPFCLFFNKNETYYLSKR